MLKSVNVVLFNKEGEVLAVSRKTNHNDFGLVGGKVDPEDESEEAAAIRETREETGLTIFNLRPIFAKFYDGRVSTTFLADYSGEINYTEPHIVKWTHFGTLIVGSFGDYNEEVSRVLDHMEIYYKYFSDDKIKG